MSTAATLPLRPNVGAIITDDSRHRVLMFRRAGMAADTRSWQFPQGGLDAGEDPEAGLRRELREEIGTDDVDVLERLPEPIAYEYPPDVLAALRREAPAKARYRGQAQTWYLVRLRAGTAQIRFDHQPAEFDAFEWVPAANAVARVVPFKQDAYRRALAAFRLLPAARV